MSRLPYLVLSILLSATGSSGAQTSRQLVGTWQLVSRIDRDQAEHVLSETSLGATPLGYLIGYTRTLGGTKWIPLQE
jgi:hypothetical protein